MVVTPKFASFFAILIAVPFAIMNVASSAYAATPSTPGSSSAASADDSVSAGHLTTDLAGPCQYRDGTTSCLSLDPLVHEYIHNRGDLSGCIFRWRVNWGDGSKRTTIVLNGPRDGWILIGSHSYDPRLHRQYEIVSKGSVLAGPCTAMNGHEPFDLLSYLALGDSYSSGTGSTSYLGGTGFGFQDGNECLRSINSYSEVLDKYFGNPSPNKKTGDSPTFLFHACNGAVINDFTHPQITDDHKKVPPQLVTPDLSFGSVGLVTFTIGGNDALFARVMKYCATRTKTHQTCQARWSRAVDDSLATIEPRLVHLYQQVRDTAKLATGGEVIALGYPRFFPPGQAKQCPTGVPFHHFLPSDMAWINNEIFRIDAKIQKAARTAGIVFVDAYRAFRNHELCDKHPYLNYIVFVPAAAKFVESYHPKAKGQSVLAQLIESRLTKTQG